MWFGEEFLKVARGWKAGVSQTDNFLIGKAGQRIGFLNSFQFLGYRDGGANVCRTFNCNITIHKLQQVWGNGQP